ncbi:hypothetical protein ACRAWF_22895 [Streptomyces sp. L7]
MQPASTLRMAALALLWGSGFLWIKLALGHGLSRPDHHHPLRPGHAGPAGPGPFQRAAPPP